MGNIYEYSLSIIIPTLNEGVNIVKTLECTARSPNVEVIVVDGGSKDGTVELAKSWGAVLLTSSPNRALQMNAGAYIAKGKILLFLHADTLLPKEFHSHIKRIINTPGAVAGAFRLRIDAESHGFRLIEELANWRTSFFQMAYGDQGIFLKAKTFHEIKSFPQIAIMEDFNLIRQLRKRGNIMLAPASVITSARRWEKLGIIKTTLINKAVVSAYWMGIKPSYIAKWYQSNYE